MAQNANKSATKKKTSDKANDNAKSISLNVEMIVGSDGRGRRKTKKAVGKEAFQPIMDVNIMQ